MRFLPAMLLLAILFASGTQAGGLGRLFFTPDQRTQLETDFARNTSGEDAPSSALTINGIVQQHGGARTVWINGVAQKSEHVGEPATEAVAVPGKSQAVKIKVGQKLLLNIPQLSPTSAE